MKKCKRCNGTGHVHDAKDDQGKVWYGNKRHEPKGKVCPRCHGTGTVR